MHATKLFRAPEKPVLADENAAATPLCSGDAKVDKRLGKDLHAEIAVLQEKLYAERDRKVLLVLQGVDCSGKDGTVQKLFRKINPMGLRAVRFDVPTSAETAHDVLWRVHLQVPRKGEIAVFNRSHYEDVLHPVVYQTLDAAAIAHRYAHIRDFERMLAESGTVLLKVFLHISKDEQRRRLQDRIDDPDKHWKFDPSDLKHREKWQEFHAAYETAIAETDTAHAPWHIVPADSKPHRDLAVATLLAETLRGMDLAFPPGDPKLAKLRVR
jgi:PPK2 family polyphosphate:nucleotide phosphotransferase